MSSLVPYIRRPDWPAHDELVGHLRAAMRGLDLQPLDEIPAARRSEVTAAIVDGPTAGQLASLPRLELVQSTWAGVESILPILPEGVAVARMIDPQLSDTMAEAVLAWTLYLHRDMPLYARQQRAGEWIDHPLVRTGDRRVGILGLGVLGRAAATRLGANGFPVLGWSRSAKSLDGVAGHAGASGLEAVLGGADIVVNLLPHTPDTVGLLGVDAFAAMRRGSSLINFGRGPTVDDDALLDALDSGHVGHAVLDVFDVEPLPPTHRYWTHPRVTVLPHVSGPTSPDTAAVIAAANVSRFLTDGTLPVEALVDRDRGY